LKNEKTEEMLTGGRQAGGSKWRLVIKVEGGDRKGKGEKRKVRSGYYHWISNGSKEGVLGRKIGAIGGENKEVV